MKYQNTLEMLIDVKTLFTNINKSNVVNRIDEIELLLFNMTEFRDACNDEKEQKFITEGIGLVNKFINSIYNIVQIPSRTN